MTQWKETFLLRLYALAKIPLINVAGISVESISDDAVSVRLPFRRVNRNHLGSMYFGALCIGADVAGGLIAQRLLSKVKRGKGSLIFKNFHADFLKRPEGDTILRCQDGPAIRDAVKRAEESMERIDTPVHIEAFVPSKFGDEAVAKFVLTLSVKVRA